MNAFFTTRDGVVIVRMRVEGPDRMHGDVQTEIRAGEDFAGLSYDELAALGGGEISFDPDTGKGAIVPDELDHQDDEDD